MFKRITKHKGFWKSVAILGVAFAVIFFFVTP
jgi:hypothetical protein